MPSWKVLAVTAGLVALIAQESAAQLPEIRPASARQIQADIRSGASELTVVNFWATWCIPCREEFPAFVRLGRDFDPNQVRVLFVSADFPEAVPEARQFLAEHGAMGGSYLKLGDDADFINAFNADWSGALPSTAIYGRNGELVEFWEGKTTYEQLTARVTERLAELHAAGTHNERE